MIKDEQDGELVGYWQGYTFYILCAFPNCYIHNKRRKKGTKLFLKYHLWPRQYIKHFSQIDRWIQQTSKFQGFLSESDKL